jgi:amidohydrolase
MSREELKNAVCAEIDRRRDDIIGIAQTMLHHPELGFKEIRTSALVSSTLSGLGLPVRTGLAITGVDGVLTGSTPGPSVCIMGELDSVVSSDAAVSDPTTGAAHQCGHHIQVASMLGAAMGLVGANVAPELAGSVHFLGVPAEEFLEIEYRMGLVTAGKITYLGGKQELVKLGYFDDIDIAMMVHALSSTPQSGFYFRGEANGFLAKFIRYTGRASHAGAGPHEGINALNAACLGIMAVNAQRETFQDKDAIRVHPIITKGGDVVNVVPADVRIETYVRGRSVEAIVDASRKVDRAFRAGGDAVGAETRIQNIPGYLPIFQDEQLSALAEENGRALLGEQGAQKAPFMGGSLDVGDLSHLMPVLHPFVGGTEGPIHGSNFAIVDYDSAAVAPAKMLAMTVIDLLADGASAGRKVMTDHKPILTKAQYLAMMEELSK